VRVLVDTGIFSASISRLAGHALHESVQANDRWIATSAVHIGAPLVAADTAFDRVPGLSLHR